MFGEDTSAYFVSVDTDPRRGFDPKPNAAFAYRADEDDDIVANMDALSDPALKH